MKLKALTTASALALMAVPAFAEGTLNIYNWGNYTSPEMIEKFEKETGIKVTITDYDSNDTALAKIKAGGHGFDIVVPSVSILAESPVALVDGNITSDAQRAAAQAYLEHLYSPEAQALALHHHYRAWDASAAAPEDVARFPDVTLVSIADFGGWPAVQPKFFGDGGIFDQIYEE